MPPGPKPSLTLILAATPSLGIGKNGTLPWPSLKKEMGYFARVTKRLLPRPTASDGAKRINAVVMGRKTWDSIPPKFRPLKGRLNVVVSRSSGAVDEGDAEEGPVVVGSIAAALERLHSVSASSEEAKTQVERVFVIGGGSIYSAALELPQTDRVLLTKIHNEYECDTYFSVDLEKEGCGWRRAGRKEVEEWTGENLAEDGVEEQGVRFEFCMYERPR